MPDNDRPVASISTLGHGKAFPAVHTPEIGSQWDLRSRSWERLVPFEKPAISGEHDA